MPVPLVALENGATARVDGGGSAIKVDTALLEATAPLLRIRGDSTFTASGHVVDLVGRAKVSVPADAVTLVALDRGRLNVSGGHLVNVAGGSRLNVGGDLVSLANGSLVTISNGALLNVAGGSVVSLGGSLVRFSGAGNSISVSNTFAPTALVGGVPVSGPAGSFSISGTALAGLGTAGTITINGTALTPTTPLSSLTGSLVRIQDSGTVKIGGRI